MPIVDLRGWLEVINRRRWVVVATSALILAFAIISTARSPRIYEAQAMLFIESNAPQVLQGVHEVYDLGSAGFWANEEYFQTQYNLLRTRAVAAAALERLGLSPQGLADRLRVLAADTASRGVDRPAVELLPENERATFAHKLVVFDLDPDSTVSELLEVLPALDGPDVLQRKIQVRPVKESKLVRVAIEHRDPEVATALTNAVASAYVDANLETKLNLTETAVAWLGDQVSDLKRKLEQSELALHEFKSASGMVSASMEDRQTMNSQTLEQINRELSAAVAKRITLESRRAQLQRVVAAQAPLDSLDEVRQSSVVQELKVTLAKLREEESELLVRYTAEHPRVLALRERERTLERQVADEIQNITLAIEGEFTTAHETESRLRAAIEGVKVEALELNKKEIEYGRLRRERDNNQQLYSLVLNRQKEADLTRMLRVNNVRVLENAIAPNAPIRPRTKMNIAVGVVAGLLLGLVAAFIVDLLDNTLKSQEQVERLLRVPFLGIVPAIKGQGSDTDTTRDHFIVEYPRSSVAECCRTLRTNLMFASPEAPAKCLLIASSRPREGKSTLVANLAITLAESGARTLIVDTDMRRPRLHQSFRVSNDIGVSNLVLGEATLEQAIQRTTVNRLDIVACGPIPPNPAELLHTEAFRALVTSLRQRYDRIVFDSPPVGVVTDAQVLSALVDGVVLVVHANKTTWPAARAARRRLHDVGAKLFGVVLNNVDLGGKGKHQYYEYGYYVYGEGDKSAPARA
ncbi:MAG: GumC family protein [Myxococcota bacterium]